MNLAQALRQTRSKFFDHRSTIAFVGSGGKTSALFQLAREIPSPVIATATTHLHVDQIKLADSHWIGDRPEGLVNFKKNLSGVMLVTGKVEGDRTSGLSDQLLAWLDEFCASKHLPLLIEADGSRQKPLKAPADHEPVIPGFVETVVVSAGLSGLGKPLSEEFVHHAEIFSRLSGLKINSPITTGSLLRVLTHPTGGLKNIPADSRRIALLNQTDTPELQACAKGMVEQILASYDAVLIASLKPQTTTSSQPPQVHAVYEPVAGIILAAGGSSRFGEPKPLLDWYGKPFIRRVAETALAAGLSPVVIVTGAHAQQVEAAVSDLPVLLVRNEDWQNGQSSSIRVGLAQIAPPHTESDLPTPSHSLLCDPSHRRVGYGRRQRKTGAAIFLLADQPQITAAILRALVEEHARTLASIVAPLVDGQRANPVLFDRITFPELQALKGDAGGRVLFSHFKAIYLTWLDESILSDVDTPEDYQKLIHGE
jgi:molybdenum cofactor cytidylyltransferase